MMAYAMTFFRYRLLSRMDEENVVHTEHEYNEQSGKAVFIETEGRSVTKV